MLNTNTLYMRSRGFTQDELYEFIVETAVIDLVKTGKPALLESMYNEDYDIFIENFIPETERQDMPILDPDSAEAWMLNPDVDNVRHAFHWRNAHAKSVYDAAQNKNMWYIADKVSNRSETLRDMKNNMGLTNAELSTKGFKNQLKFWLSQKRDAIAKYIDALNSWLRKFIKKYNNTPKEKRGFFRTIIHHINVAIEALTRKLHNAIQVNRGNIQDDIMASDDRVKDLSVNASVGESPFAAIFKHSDVMHDEHERKRREELKLKQNVDNGSDLEK